MQNAEIIAKVTAWQQNEQVHPLTCGNDSSHGLLIATELSGNVCLVCPDCDYTQVAIPDIVLGKGASILSPRETGRNKRSMRPGIPTISHKDNHESD